MHIKQLAGTFWESLLDDKRYQHALAAKSIIEEQTQADLKTFTACAGRKTTPLYRRVALQPLVLQTKTESVLSCDVPANMVAVGLITDSLVNPTAIWVHNIDFTIEAGRINFLVDPFLGFMLANSEKPTYDQDGNIVGKEMTVWLHAVDYDDNYLHDMWGVVLGLKAASCEEYKTIINTTYDAILSGTSSKHIEHIVATLNGIQLAKEKDTVMEIGEDSRGLFVAGVKHIYRANGAKPIVAVGDNVKAGTPLFDNFMTYRAVDDIPADVLPALTIPGHLLNNKKDLVCINQDMSGAHAAADCFEMLGNQQLSDILAGQDTINPCKFVRQHVLGNCLLCVLRGAKTPPTLASIDQDSLLRALVPPHEALLVVKL